MHIFNLMLANFWAASKLAFSINIDKPFLVGFVVMDLVVDTMVVVLCH